MIELLAIGGANADRIGRTDGPHLAGTSNPGSLKETVGGGVFNALRVAALRQVGSLGLISARGEDSAGGQIQRAVQESGVTDLSCISAGSSTATYTAILDEAGELVTALADMAIYSDALSDHLATPEIVHAISTAGAVLVDANLTELSIKSVCQAARCPVFAIAISAPKASRLMSSANAIDVVFMNHHEARRLCEEEAVEDAAKACVASGGFKQVIVTRGAHPVLIASSDGLWSVTVPNTKIADVTGAGDAMCGGTIAALLREPEISLPEAVREGIACSSLTLGVDGPIANAIGTSAFDTALTRIPTPQRLE